MAPIGTTAGGIIIGGKNTMIVGIPTGTIIGITVGIARTVINTEHD